MHYIPTASLNGLKWVIWATFYDEVFNWIQLEAKVLFPWRELQHRTAVLYHFSHYYLVIVSWPFL